MKNSKSDSRHLKLSIKLEALKDTLHKLNHDVRTPINGIIGLTNLMIEDKDRVVVRTSDISMIKDSAESIIDMIDEVLAEKDLTLKARAFPDYREITSVLDHIKRLYMPAAYEKGITLSFNCQINAPEKIPKNLATKLLQIIGNLISNAIKFTPTKGTIKILVSTCSDKKGKLLQICVEDNGICMSSDQTRAFNEGMSIERSVGTKGEKSFGLGLKHVKQMVTEEKGDISVSSAEKGTRFSVLLPIHSETRYSNINI
ncbi:hypothetical protein BH23BAC3_BH23BAC3_19640 [soil metagenome]